MKDLQIENHRLPKKIMELQNNVVSSESKNKINLALPKKKQFGNRRHSK